MVIIVQPKYVPGKGELASDLPACGVSREIPSEAQLRLLRYRR